LEYRRTKKAVLGAPSTGAVKRVSKTPAALNLARSSPGWRPLWPSSARRSIGGHRACRFHWNHL